MKNYYIWDIIIIERNWMKVKSVVTKTMWLFPVIETLEDVDDRDLSGNHRHNC